MEVLATDISNEPDIIKMVKEIEGRPATTQNHYGDYMAFLSPISKDRIVLEVMGMALVKVGANPQGIAWANRILVGQ